MIKLKDVLKQGTIIPSLLAELEVQEVPKFQGALLPPLPPPPPPQATKNIAEVSMNITLIIK